MEESRDKNDIEPVVNHRLRDLPVGEKVGKTTYTGFLEPLPRISFAKQKTETFTNQGFRIMVGLVGLEPMTSTMSRSKIVHKNTLTTHNKRFKKRGNKALHICMVG